MAKSALGLLVTLLLIACLTGCGVPLQEDPQGFPAPTPSAPPSRPPEGVLTATVFLADDTRLIPVRRPTSDRSPGAVLALLGEGPTGTEADEGLRSALVPGSIDPATVQEGPAVRGRIFQVAVTEQFTRISGDDQLLATAQLVWTLTEASSAHRVQVLFGGSPIELPTDEGLTGRPVRRADFESVAPRPVSAAVLDWLGGSRR